MKKRKRYIDDNDDDNVSLRKKLFTDFDHDSTTLNESHVKDHVKSLANNCDKVATVNSENEMYMCEVNRDDLLHDI